MGIYIGTAGYSYKDWIGPFYPPGTRNEEMLPHYAAEFSFVEVNSTYYRMPNRHLMWNMQAKTPPGFLFAVKAHKSITHLDGQEEDLFGQFREAVAPLSAEGKLACILAQYPYSFRNSAANKLRLHALREGMGELPVMVEFRHQSWVQEDTFRFLQRMQLGYVCVDEPRLGGLVGPVAACTGSIGYVRFHGRNAARWWNHEQAYERYDYLYQEAELLEWLPRLKSLSRQTEALFISFNNHYQGQSVRNGRMLRQLLSEGGPGSGDGKKGA